MTAGGSTASGVEVLLQMSSNWPLTSTSRHQGRSVRDVHALPRLQTHQDQTCSSELLHPAHFFFLTSSLSAPPLHHHGGSSGCSETISDLRSDFRLCPFSDRAIKTVTFIPLELSYTFMSALFSVTFHFVTPDSGWRQCVPWRLTLLVFVLFILSDLKNVNSACIWSSKASGDKIFLF